MTTNDIYSLRPKLLIWFCWTLLIYTGFCRVVVL